MKPSTLLGLSLVAVVGWLVYQRMQETANDKTTQGDSPSVVASQVKQNQDTPGDSFAKAFTAIATAFTGVVDGINKVANRNANYTS